MRERDQPRSGGGELPSGESNVTSFEGNYTSYQAKRRR